MANAAEGIRARNRAAIESEILRVGRRAPRLATAPRALSLRAVARDLGMASSAVYRYVASRDELLTRLIVDGLRRARRRRGGELAAPPRMPRR